MCFIESIIEDKFGFEGSGNVGVENNIFVVL